MFVSSVNFLHVDTSRLVASHNYNTPVSASAGVKICLANLAKGKDQNFL